MKKPLASSGSAGLVAAGDERRALVSAELDVAAAPSRTGARLTIAPIWVVSSLGQADAQAVDPLGERLDERLVDVLVHEQPRGRAAGLALQGEVHAAHDAVERRVEVGVGEDHDRVLAAAARASRS